MGSQYSKEVLHLRRAVLKTQASRLGLWKSLHAMMYLYLNTCPGIYRPWFAFYKNLFETQSPNKIILTLNRLMKGTITPQNKFLKGLAQNIFRRLASLLSLRYEEIQSMSQSQGMTKNESLTAKERKQSLTFEGSILS